MPTPEADLLNLLKRERLNRIAKQPLQRSLFVKINALVQTYGLGEDFLHKLDEFTDNFSWEQLPYNADRVKEKLQLPLFALATPEKYHLTMAIIGKVNNPYLHFAHSPDEILLCTPLFRRYPDLEPERLAAHHFQTLLLGDLAGEKTGCARDHNHV
jgi:hypothetical protein